MACHISKWTTSVWSRQVNGQGFERFMLFIHISWQFFFFSLFFPPARIKNNLFLLSRRHVRGLVYQAYIIWTFAVHFQREKDVVTGAAVVFQTSFIPGLYCPCHGAVLMGRDFLCLLLLLFRDLTLYSRHLFEEYVVRYSFVFFSVLACNQPAFVISIIPDVSDMPCPNKRLSIPSFGLLWSFPFSLHVLAKYFVLSFLIPLQILHY